MKGLLLKDFYMIVKHCRLNLLVNVIFIVVAFFSKDNISFLFFPLWISGVIPVTLLSFDERSGWAEYSGTLPYSKAQLVSAKYIMGLLIEASTAAMILLFIIIRGSVMETSDTIEALSVTVTAFSLSFLMPTFCLPFCFKFGVEKGRMVYLIGIVVIAILFSVSVMADISFNTGAASSLIAAAAVTMYALSWLVSTAVYKSK